MKTMIARFDYKCAECGEQGAKGSSMWYNKDIKRAFHDICGRKLTEAGCVLDSERESEAMVKEALIAYISRLKTDIDAERENNTRLGDECEVMACKVREFATFLASMQVYASRVKMNLNALTVSGKRSIEERSAALRTLEDLYVKLGLAITSL